MSTITERRQLQNIGNYKTSTITITLQNVESKNVKKYH
jgi:hypothetical protein